jgi:FKBP-type peptidyl-prolyl cis-trans isomerase FklB
LTLVRAICEAYSAFQGGASETGMGLPFSLESFMKRVISTFVVCCLSTLTVGEESGGLGVSERYSYAMGVSLGQLLRGQGIEKLDSHAFAAAIDDVLGGKPLRLSAEEMQEAIREQQQVFVQQRAQRAQAKLAAERDFLTRNAAEDGVVVSPSGLQYRVLASGDGAQPGSDATVRVHYHGTLLDGSVFDSSVERGEPAEFALSGVIPGFREAISQMRIGDRWRVFIPSALAYGERGAGADIGPNETLTFEIELLGITR